MHIDIQKQRFIQYFHQKPDNYILKKVIKCFNLDEIVCDQIISKYHLCESKVISNFEDIIPDLALYYSPRVINNFFYITPLNFTNCITMLRNIVSFFDYIIKNKPMVISNKKVIFYTIHKASDFNENGLIPIKIRRHEPTLITF